VYGLKPRHRRKAGSGPPANALIAWIGADPYLRDAAVTANHRREIALPPPTNSRTARAAVAACFVLAFSAVLSITTLSDGLVVPRETNTLAPPSQDSVTVPGQGITPPLPEGRGASPALIPGPSAVTPTMLGKPPTSPALPQDTFADHPSSDSGVPRGGSPPAGTTNPPPPAAPPHRADHANGPAPLVAPLRPRSTGRPGGGTPRPGSGGTGHAGTPATPGAPAGPASSEPGPAPAPPGPDHPQHGGPGEGAGIGRGPGPSSGHGSPPAGGSAATPGSHSGRR
jgi:hypothetical protein